MEHPCPHPEKYARGECCGEGCTSTPGDEVLLEALFERMARPRRLTGKRGVTTNARYCDLYDRVAARLGRPGSIT